MLWLQLDMKIRSILYKPSAPYAYECGGTTTEVAKLTNQEVIDFHKRFYSPNNMTAIFIGSYNRTRAHPQRLIVLSRHPSTLAEGA